MALKLFHLNIIKNNFTQLNTKKMIVNFLKWLLCRLDKSAKQQAPIEQAAGIPNTTQFKVESQPGSNTDMFISVGLLNICLDCYMFARELLENTKSREVITGPRVAELSDILHYKNWPKLVLNFSAKFCNELIDIFSEDEDMWEACAQIKTELKHKYSK